MQAHPQMGVGDKNEITFCISQFYAHREGRGTAMATWSQQWAFVQNFSPA